MVFVSTAQSESFFLETVKFDQLLNFRKSVHKTPFLFSGVEDVADEIILHSDESQPHTAIPVTGANPAPFFLPNRYHSLVINFVDLFWLAIFCL